LVNARRVSFFFFQATIIMPNNNNIPIEIFKSPVRKTTTHSYNYVDYTPRRLQASSVAATTKAGSSSAFSTPTAHTLVPNLESNPKNSLSYARERRSYFYHQLAVESNDPFEESDYMDSPAVRRHFGVSDRVVPIDDDDNTSTYFDKKMKQASDLEALSQ
jgi:hypothetical protein